MLSERNTLSLAALKAGLVLAFAWKLGFILKASPLSQITPDQSVVSTSLLSAVASSVVEAAPHGWISTLCHFDRN